LEDESPVADQEEVAAIPLVEERLAVTKRQVESERLRVRIGVDTREELVPVELVHDEVKVERIPRNVPVSELPGVRLEGNTTIIPVVEEVVVVEKRLILVEEIRVTRDSATRTEEIPVQLRKEHAAIERQPAAAAQAMAAPE
jgi:uncharacterized protein (TIGR02271 family)